MKPSAGTSAATPPAALPPPRCSPKSAATNRQRKAAALCDVTNLLPLPDTPTPTRPTRTGRRPLPPPPSDAASTCSSTASASVTPAPTKPSSAAVLGEESSVLRSGAISTVYARHGATVVQGRRAIRTTDKGKAPAAVPAAAGTASCPQLGKSARNTNRKTPTAQGTRPISSSAPCHEAKKKRPSASTPKFPDDFVKKQRAYFADIDAFELPEEEVSETDLE